MLLLEMACREILSGTACSERVVRKNSTSKAVFAKKDVFTCWPIKFHTPLNEPVKTVDGPMQHSGPTQNVRRGKITTLRDNTPVKCHWGLKKLNEFQKRRLPQLPNSLFSSQGTRRFFEDTFFCSGESDRCSLIVGRAVERFSPEVPRRLSGTDSTAPEGAYCVSARTCFGRHRPKLSRHRSARRASWHA